jgi:hypothetical protein
MKGIGFLAALGLLGGATLWAAEDMPKMILDDAAADWVVDRFAGNSTAGPEFFQGPAREVGGLGRCGACPMPDGTVYIPFAGGLAHVDTDGTLRLVIEAGHDLVERTTNQVCAGSGLAYNPKDKMLYVVGPNCLRRLITRPDGPARLELVAPHQASTPPATTTRSNRMMRQGTVLCEPDTEISFQASDRRRPVGIKSRTDREGYQQDAVPARHG